MVCIAENLHLWKDFPRGLRVLLLDKDEISGAETKLKLEAMNYIVSLFCNENDAIEAISKSGGVFHVALVEVTTNNTCESFKFLEMARDIAIIVISDAECMSTMMKCIALGATQFLQKPLSEEKLRNIWQHVAHKAFNAGGNTGLSKSLEPIKETVVSMLKLQPETIAYKSENPSNDEILEKNNVQDNFPAPTEEESVKDEANFSNLESSTELKNNKLIAMSGRCSSSSVPKPVDNTRSNSNFADEMGQPKDLKDKLKPRKEDVNSADEQSAVVESFVPCSHSAHAENKEKKKKQPMRLQLDHKNNSKKLKVDWTPELHKRFVQAVDELGIDQVTPSKILELMKVEGLTRRNVASHLQKYRMHRRHILPKDDKRWHHANILDSTTMRYMPNPPILAFPTNHPNYHHHAGVHVAGLPVWTWKSYPMINADAWGFPVIPQYGQYSFHSHRFQVSAYAGEKGKTRDSYDPLREEVIDKTIKEAMKKPWLPLPIGLKPPSIEAVMAELHSRGINNPLTY